APTRGSGGSPAKSNRDPGAEIGSLHRRGLSLAAKFSLFISLLILLISLLFGLVVIRLFKDKLKEEIKRSGYQQVLTLKPLGKRVYRSFVDTWLMNTKAEAKSYADTPAGVSDKADLKQILDGDPRILDLAVFASKEPAKDPSGVVVIARGLTTFSMPNDPTKFETVDGGDPDIKVWWGDITVDDKHERVLFFRVPLEGKDDKLLATGNLILSASQIDQEVQSLIRKIALFGLLFVLAGIALSLGLASLVTSPINVLVRDMDIVARGDLEHETRPQTSDEIGLLAMAFNRMTKSIRSAREHERQVERINADLSILKEIHAKLMPEKIPQIPGYDIFTGYYCAREVGGDYYDFIPVDRDHLAFVIADVSGKGIPGSMYMGYTRTILRMMATENLSPADVLSKTNYHVAKDIKRGMFVTAMYAIVNVRTREMTVASAGHNPMVIWRAATRTHELVRPNGIALGFDKGPIFDRTVREQKLKLNRGDRVVMYTDGVVEAMNAEHEEWGDEALEAFVQQNAEIKSKDFVRLLLKALDDHKGEAEQHDDITLTTFRIE
ncbi:MAG: SpoIIE family protein phosphatase, partial [Planctomycetota bacterium]|nr:SpoIIE family protein phosphatase [Planctomycetota bacterium]